MLKLEINTSNVAFADDPGFELARILREVAKHVEDGCVRGDLRDINGNKVGWFSID